MVGKLIPFTPGPLKIPESVWAALGNPPCIYHREPIFQAIFDAVREETKALLELSSDYRTGIFAGTGTAANEVCLHALSSLGKGLLLVNGYFGQRLYTQASAANLDFKVLNLPFDRPIDSAVVESSLQLGDYKWVYYVVHETRMGIFNGVVELPQLAKKYGAWIGADIVSVAWAVNANYANLDVMAASSSKGIMACPGLALVFASRSFLEVSGQFRSASYYLDLWDEVNAQDKNGMCRFAQPVALYSALEAACTYLNSTGIVFHQQRIPRQLADIQTFLRIRAGILPQLDPKFGAGVVQNFILPEKLSYSEFRQRMIHHGYYVTYGMPGDERAFQVCTIGAITDEEVEGFNRAIHSVLLEVGL